MAAPVVVPTVIYLMTTIAYMGSTPAIQQQVIPFDDIAACNEAREDFINGHMKLPSSWTKADTIRSPDFVTAQCSKKRK